MTRIRRLSAALLVAGVLGIAAPAAATALSKITISGATASYPLVTLLANKYVKLHPNKVKFKITEGGAQVGVEDVAKGKSTIGDVSRDPLTNDPVGLSFQPIARYGICMITNKSNPLSNLTTAQAISIFTGKIREWSGVPGAIAKGTIDLFSRATGAGVLTSFQTVLLEGKTVSKLAETKPSEGLLRQLVENDPSGIGFVSNYQSDKGTVNAVGLNGVACNKATITSGQYSGTARFYEVTKGKPTGAALAFIGWILHSSAAKKIISSQWVPII
jgi:phosphate transport system substrate-binding protein